MHLPLIALSVPSYGEREYKTDMERELHSTSKIFGLTQQVHFLELEVSILDIKQTLTSNIVESLPSFSQTE